MKSIVIIQARMGSERLPGKVLLPLGSSVILDYVVSRCRAIPEIAEVIVATSILEPDEAIADWCKENGVPCFRGSEDDVLSRYYECAKPYRPDYVLRVTADCPFVDYEMAAQMIRLMEEYPSDMVQIMNEDGLTRGLVVEMVSFGTLEYMYRHSKEPRHREHVTYYAKEYPQQFKLPPYMPPAYMHHPQLRITVDTTADYDLCRALVAQAGNDKLILSRDIVGLLLKHPEIAALNAHISQKPVV
ncbi:glycosyltransferase family protein [uncultured Paenibacillus sp.]|uniref:glycosyltransferase family protein n=1 Tax=uncultured Paenibacillus sp. TaxID=227322 RepID=UPI0028D7E83D|nr:glycosyltransferase family protein [uncultured Paenibacillus sp.]